VGEPVAAVLAPSRYLAEDVAELVEVDYEPLPAVVDAERSLQDPPALLYEEWESNVYFHDEFEGGNVEEAFESAAGVIKERFSSQRHTGSPLETRGIVASYDPATGDIHLHANWQDVFLARAVISRILDWPESKLRISAPDSGGGFGVKLPVYPEEVAACCMALLLDGAWNVKWIQDRHEDLLGTTQHRDMIAELQLAYDDRGTILGLRGRFISDAGAYGVPARGNTVEGMMAAKDITGPYNIQAYAYELDVVMTNKAPLCVYRGVALPMSIAWMERLMDELAEATGLDRREVRQRNLVRKFPYESVTGWVYEPGSYAQALDRALELVGFDEFPEYQRKMRQQGRHVGLGICTGVQAVALGATWYGERGLPISSQEGCHLRMDSRGRVHVQLGTTTQGQGIDTAAAQIVADELGMELSRITVGMGDTAVSPYGGGAWASRQAQKAGTAAHLASRRLRDKLLRIAAHQLEVSPEDLELAEGRAYVRGNPSSGLAIEEIARIAHFIADRLPEGVDPALEETAHFDGPAGTFANSTHAVILEVDPATSHIDFHRWVIIKDCGTIINPLIVQNQLYGGLAQGIGGTIYEHSSYTEQGQPVATTFMDYLMPTAHDVPELEIEFIETPSPHTGRGIKGMGESGVCFAPGAILTGVSNALGVKANRLELSPKAIYALMRQRMAGIPPFDA
jgi:carbon-monoxide dehydrogenase large subunit